MQAIIAEHRCMKLESALMCPRSSEVAVAGHRGGAGGGRHAAAPPEGCSGHSGVCKSAHAAGVRTFVLALCTAPG